jgi:hypothetical protein
VYQSPAMTGALVVLLAASAVLVRSTETSSW